MMRCFQGDRKMKHGKKCKIDKYTLILIILSHFDAIRRTSGFLETGAELPLNQKGNILADAGNFEKGYRIISESVV